MDTEAPMHPSPAKTILVVDDDPSTVLICVKKLRAEGFTVLEAEGSSVLASAPLSCDDFATKSIAKHDVRWYDLPHVPSHVKHNFPTPR
jgi:hypothetical protein